MHADDHQEPLEHEADEVYDDGFGEAFDLEADQISGPKRREKDRRTAVRRDTPKIVDSTRRDMGRRLDRQARRDLARRAAAEQAHIRWRKYRPLVIRVWPRYVPFPLTAAILSAIYGAMSRATIAIVTKKLEGATEVGDLITVPARTLVAAGVAEGLRHAGMVSPERQEALTEAIYDGLDASEKVIKVVIKAAGSGEAEDWETEDWDTYLAGDGFSNGEDHDADGFGARKAAPGNGAAPGRARARDSAAAAQALRQGARYLLRLERQLLGQGQ